MHSNDRRALWMQQSCTMFGLSGSDSLGGVLQGRHRSQEVQIDPVGDERCPGFKPLYPSLKSDEVTKVWDCGTLTHKEAATAHCSSLACITISQIRLSIKSIF